MALKLNEPNFLFKNNTFTNRVLELLPVEPDTIQVFSENAFVFDSSQGQLVLWVHRGLESILAFQQQIQKVLLQKGFRGFLSPWELKDGRTYAEWEEGSWFYITNWPDCSKVSFSDQKHVAAILDLIIEFRKVIATTGTLFIQSEPITSGLNLFDQMKAKVELLASMEMLAKHRLKPSKFDKIFLENFRIFYLQAERALKILQNINYSEAFLKLTNNDVILYRIDRRNIRVTLNGQAICLRPGNFQVENPVLDLAILLNKTGRFNHWRNNWWRDIIQRYEQHFKLSVMDMNIIVAYSQFPWDFYQLAESYYLNLTNSSLWFLVDKLERILQAETWRESLLGELNKQFK